MTNEEKASQMANAYRRRLEQDTTLCNDDLNAASIEVYNRCLKMAEWKDEQFAKEKRALVDKAVLLLQMIFVQQDVPVERRKEYIEDFKQTLEETK